jgi:hypothetical protein
MIDTRSSLSLIRKCNVPGNGIDYCHQTLIQCVHGDQSQPTTELTLSNLLGNVGVSYMSSQFASLMFMCHAQLSLMPKPKLVYNLCLICDSLCEGKPKGPESHGILRSIWELLCLLLMCLG